MLKIKPFFRWYDLWVGIFIDTDKDAIYVCPVPMIGIKLEWSKVIRWKAWQVLFMSQFRVGKGVYPTGRYQVYQWWCLGPVQIRRFVAGPDANRV